MARERPWDMKNWADSAAQAIMKDPPTMAGKVQSDEMALALAAPPRPKSFMHALLRGPPAGVSR
jgi:hypothetical protein